MNMNRKNIILTVFTILILSSGILGIFSAFRLFGFFGFITDQEEIIWTFFSVTCFFSLLISAIIFYYLYEKYVERILTKNWERKEYIFFGITFSGFLIIIVELIIIYYSFFLIPYEIYIEFVKIDSISGFILLALIWIGGGLLLIGGCLLGTDKGKEQSEEAKKKKIAENRKKCEDFLNLGKTNLISKQYQEALNNFRQALKASEGLWDSNLSIEINNLLKQAERLVSDENIKIG